MPKHGIVRRVAVLHVLGATAFVALGCSLGQSQDVQASGRLRARPRTDLGAPKPGTSPLGLATERDGLLIVPEKLPPGPVPVVVLLHGAGGAARGIAGRVSAVADSAGAVLVVPDSRGPTWDGIRGEYGPDIEFIDRALQRVFSMFAVDPARVIVAGFSDGASYALALGRMNGDLFTRVVAFSPGFVPPGNATGRPEVFITHGDNDPVLPYDATSRRIVPAMTRAGYPVTFRQFVGGHTVPAGLAREAFAWAVENRPAEAGR
jgi:phospholipase/carboxylesterase